MMILDFLTNILLFLIYITYGKVIILTALLFALSRISPAYSHKIMLITFAFLSIILFIWAFCFPIGFRETEIVYLWKNLFGPLVTQLICKALFFAMGAFFFFQALMYTFIDFEEENYEI
jgi:hypothetical protein